MDENLLMKLGEITETLAALCQRIERIEKNLDRIEGLDVIALRVEGMEKDIAAIKTLPARFIWALVLSFAAGVGGLILELIRK